MVKNNYGVDSIKALTAREAVRKKFGMYIGDNGVRGLHHLVYEIISNSTDEMLNGYGDKIIVRLLDRKTIEIQDFGRGIPFGKNKDGEEVLEMIFTTLHSGGKMDNTKEGSGYKFSGGTNGVGTSVLNFLSTNLKITVKRDGKIAELIFKNGETTGLKIIGKCEKEDTGTTITFSPDLEIFSSLKGFDEDYIKRMLNDQSILQKSNFIFENKINNKTFSFKNSEGIKKYILDKNNEVVEKEDEEGNIIEENKKALTPKTEIIYGEGLEFTGPEGQYVAIDYAFEVVGENKSSIKGYTNSISNPDGGNHVIGLKAGIYKGIVSLIQRTTNKGILNDLEQDDLIGSVIGIINVKLSDPAFEGQTKGKLTTLYIKKLITDGIAREIERKLSDKDLAEITKMLSIKIETRKKIEEAELKALEKINNEATLLKKLGTKLLDANNKNRSETELFIIEGDSAGGNLKKERNPSIHAIMPLKGKALNVLSDKNKKKIYSNAEVNNLMYAISGGYIGNEFDPKKHLRYGKIIILADADIDGLHISLLVLSILIKFYPKLIEDGYVYLGISPLFICKYKSSYKYFYTEQEKNKFLATSEGKKYDTARFKGLGELDSEDLYDIALGKGRTLVKVTVDDMEASKEFFNMIMGDEPRKKFEFIQSYIQSFLERLDKNEVFNVRKTKDLTIIGKDNMAAYQKEVNEERGLPALEDGLKNVHRRIIYTLKERLKSSFTGTFIKSARVVGETMGIFHPHGDKSIFDAMVGLTQDFSNNIQLVKGKGAFGSLFSKGGVAAPRYNEVKIGASSESLLLEDIKKNAVKFINNYDDTNQEPIIFPAKLPYSLLLNNYGLGAAGVSSSIVSHNIKEVINAVKGYIETKGKNYNALEYIKGPDVSSGGYILNTQESLKEIYENPEGGTFKFRVNIDIEQEGKEKVLVIKEVPYFIYNAEGLIEKINLLIEDKDLLGVKSIVDRSGKEEDKKGKKDLSSKKLKLVIYIKQDIDINLIIEDLYKKTDLERNFRYIPTLVNRYRIPKKYTLNEIISEFIEFRKETLKNIFSYEIEELKKEIAYLNIKCLHVINFEKIAKILIEGKKQKKKREEVKKEIMNALKITADETEIIITTQLISVLDLEIYENKIKKAEKELARLEKLLSEEKSLNKYIINEYDNMLKEIDELESLLKIKVTEKNKERFDYLKSKYGNTKRKTKILTNKEIEQLNSLSELLEKKKKEEKNKIEEKTVGIVVNKSDFILKIVGKDETISNRIKELGDKEEVKHAHICNNTGTLYVLSDNKKGYFLHIHKLKDKEDTAINRLVKGFEGDIVGSFVYGPGFDNTEIMIIYEDDKKHIGGYKILKSDLAKNKQGYNLGKFKILFAGETDSIDLSKIVSLKRYDIKKDINIKLKDLPSKKSPSSGKKIV